MSSSRSSTSGGNEVLHIALGDVSCAITAHWQTLQGWAALESPSGDPSITHATYNGRYVPRSLLVGTVRSSLGGSDDSSLPSAAAWSGPIETMILSTDVNNRTSMPAASSDPMCSGGTNELPSWDRYRVPVPAAPPSYASQGRQVNWEEEAEDMEDEEEKWDPDLRPRYVAPPESSSALQQTPMMDPAPSIPAPSSDPKVPGTSWYDVLRQAPMSPSLCLDAPPDWEGSAEFRDALWDRIRRILEACDQAPGLWLMQDAPATAAAGTPVLHTWQEECPRAPGATTLYVEETASPSTKTENSSSLNTMMMQHMCVLAEQTAASSLWLPLHCPDAGSVARALECVTLCYRRTGGAVAFCSTVDEEDMMTTWNYRDFRRALLRHAASRNVLELDVLSDAPRGAWLSWLQPGTSVERDARETSRGAPGDWMNAAANDGGMWTSLTPPAGGAADRNRHYHYALAASLRYTAIAPNEMPKYVTSIMESMGIRYRPEQALCTVVRQGFSSFAAPYQSLPTSTMAIVGNTTRIYPYLHARATVRLPSYLRGCTMERDDVLEAQMACLDLRDSYAPPRGSGLSPLDDDDATELDG
jgi:hypothetical protein